MASDAERKIDAYLQRVRARLRGLSGEETHEILEELRSHIVENSAAGGEMTAATVEATLAALGSPEELGNEYVTNALLARAELSRSPFRILESLFRWASLSVAGFFVLLGSIAGYFFGGAFILVALLKPFHPETAGLWTWRDATGDLNLSLRLGFGQAPASGHEMLGRWIIPGGLIAGCGLVILTTQTALWCTRVCRRSQAFPYR
jgi:hypothetical protein